MVHVVPQCITISAIFSSSRISLKVKDKLLNSTIRMSINLLILLASITIFGWIYYTIRDFFSPIAQYRTIYYLEKNTPYTL